ncbi:hypothetical protein XA68_17226 [Ophiocordyceps unilateralis]|uniref:Uncharacterized protein n=1 Tax=Ophiocordyceps unilateralis TaxID=268505 RepID=A0A2A9P578_OPHUN|nr:hypothetical protein XA68_17226 [Ophiocordyceps unilateralis]
MEPRNRRDEMFDENDSEGEPAPINPGRPSQGHPPADPFQGHYTNNNITAAPYTGHGEQSGGLSVPVEANRNAIIPQGNPFPLPLRINTVVSRDSNTSSDAEAPVIAYQDDYHIGGPHHDRTAGFPIQDADIMADADENAVRTPVQSPVQNNANGFAGTHHARLENRMGDDYRVLVGYQGQDQGQNALNAVHMHQRHAIVAGNLPVSTCASHESGHDVVGFYRDDEFGNVNRFRGNQINGNVNPLSVAVDPFNNSGNGNPLNNDRANGDTNTFSNFQFNSVISLNNVNSFNNNVNLFNNNVNSFNVNSFNNNTNLFNNNANSFNNSRNSSGNPLNNNRVNGNTNLFGNVQSIGNVNSFNNNPHNNDRVIGNPRDTQLNHNGNSNPFETSQPNQSVNVFNLPQIRNMINYMNENRLNGHGSQYNGFLANGNVFLFTNGPLNGNQPNGNQAIGNVNSVDNHSYQPNHSHTHPGLSNGDNEANQEWLQQVADAIQVILPEEACSRGRLWLFPLPFQHEPGALGSMLNLAREAQQLTILWVAESSPGDVRPAGAGIARVTFEYADEEDDEEEDDEDDGEEDDEDEEEDEPMSEHEITQLQRGRLSVAAGIELEALGLVEEFLRQFEESVRSREAQEEANGETNGEANREVNEEA